MRDYHGLNATKLKVLETLVEHDRIIGPEIGKRVVGTSAGPYFHLMQQDIEWLSDHQMVAAYRTNDQGQRLRFFEYSITDKGLDVYRKVTEGWIGVIVQPFKQEVIG